MYIVLPAFRFWDAKEIYKGHKRLDSGFQYTSDINKDWLTIKELKEILKADEVGK